MRTLLQNFSNRGKEYDETKVRIADTFSIVTSNNIYTFSVIDPVQFYGLVAGGVVGPRPQGAFLTRSSIKVGSRVQVVIPSVGGYRFITTSKIRIVSHWKDEAEEADRKTQLRSCVLRVKHRVLKISATLMWE